MRDGKDGSRRVAVWAILAAAVAIKVVVAGYVGFFVAAALGASQAVAAYAGHEENKESAIESLVGWFTMLVFFSAAAAAWAAVTAALQSRVLRPAPTGWILRSATAAAIMAASLCAPLSIANRVWPVLADLPGPIVQFMGEAAAEGFAVFLIQRTMLAESQ
jgi:hypothetical protein